MEHVRANTKVIVKAFKVRSCESFHENVSYVLTSGKRKTKFFGLTWLNVDILTPGYTHTTRIGKGVLEVRAPVRCTGLRTPVGYFLYFWTYCGSGYGWTGLYGVWNPTAIPVLPILILKCCAER